MKVRVFDIVALASLAACFFVACGDTSSGSDDMDPTNQYSKVDSYDDLPLCTKSNDGDSVYVADEHMYLFCSDGFWSEFIVSTDPDGSASSRGKLNIYAEADDTIPSLDFLPYCNSSYQSDVYFIASLNSYMKCDDYDWVEFKPTKTTSSSSATSTVNDTIASISRLASFSCDASHEGNSVYVADEGLVLVCDDGSWTEYVSYSSSSYRSSSSSARNYYKGNVLRDTILGVCDSTKEGSLAYDSSNSIGASSTRYYECRSGLWLSTTEYYLDTRGFPQDTTEGAFKRGVWVEYVSSTDTACKAPFNKGNSYSYVFVGGTWRKASAMEICFNKACYYGTSGMIESKGSTRYICSGSSWGEVLFYDMPETQFLNSSLTYGTVTDAQSNTYKTITIGGREWMAENMKYSDSTKTSNLTFHNFCYDGKAKNCEKGGRFYHWNAALDLVSDYNDYLKEDLDPSGICPTGWHVPDTTEWRTLVKAANSYATNLMATGAWRYYSSVTPTNSTGFSAVPAGLDNTEKSNISAAFCTSTQYSAQRYYVFTMSYSSTTVSKDYRYKDSPCSLRCIKNAGTVTPTSSSSVPQSSSPVAPELSSSSLVVSSSSLLESSSAEVVESSSSAVIEMSSSGAIESSASEEE